jgi:predicted ATPase
MIDAVHQYDGYVVQSAGDGIFALFGAPLAHEDHPQRAVHAAIGMCEALSDINERGDRPKIEVRIGIDTGEVVLRTVDVGGHTEYTPVGYTANLAARMQSVAPAGAVVISENTQHLVEDYFQLRELGLTHVKGVEQPINLYQVMDTTKVRSHFDLALRRGLTRFVGREREISELNRALGLALAGRGQIVALVAEPGTGKSRLLHEFRAVLPSQCEVLAASSVSHGRVSPWLPLLDLMRGYFAFQESDDEANRREKVRIALIALDPELSDSLPYLLALLGIQATPDPLAHMDARIRRQRMLDALRRILVRKTLNQPLVLIFEDLHWIDEETQALLDILADSIANLHALLLVSYRPEYRHGWTNRSFYSQLRLTALEPENVELMLSALLGTSAELDPLKRLIIERTDGNPFFIEETVQALFGEGVLVRDGPVKVKRSVAQLSLPPTVQGLLAARIDRLSPDQKDMLQTLAVIGRVSPLPVIRQLTSRVDSNLPRMTADLQAGEFIYEQQTASGAEYVFKHALTQEVAYDSMLIERRKALHERAAQAIELTYQNRLQDHYSELAYHSRRSGNSQKAVTYLRLAGEQAAQRSANAEAVTHLADALSVLQPLPETTERMRQELELQIARGVPLGMLKGHVAQDVGAVYMRAQELCRQIGETALLFPVLTGLRLFHHIRGEFQAARELGEQLLDLGQRLHDPLLILGANRMLGDTLFWLGELPAARAHFARAIALYNSHRQRSALSFYGYDEGVFGHSYAALVTWLMGHPDQGLTKAKEALTLAQELAHPYSIAAALAFASRLHLYRRDLAIAKQYAEACIALSQEGGFAFWLIRGNLLLGRLRVDEGHCENGIAQIRQGLASYQAMGAGLGRSDFLGLLAEACAQTGRIQEGLTVLDEALAWMHKSAERNCEAELYRLKAELLLQTDSAKYPQVESCFRYGLQVAREQSAKSWELRAAISLARLLANHGRRHEARGMLAEIYNWFTEGFDTADLKDARALLDELTA